MKICFIGNNAKGMPVSDGGRIKMRNIMSEYKKMGHEISVVDLYKWQIRFLSIVANIKKALKEQEVIIVMAGPKGSRMVLKLINSFKKKSKCKIVFIPVGLGTIDSLVKKIDLKNLGNFINSVDYYGVKDDKMARYLKNIDLVVPENEILYSLYKKFYHLDNVLLLQNFRYSTPIKRVYKRSGSLKIVYMSRIVENKGALDLLNVAKNLADKGLKISVDFYGEIQLENPDVFLKQLDKNFVYKGICDPKDSIKTLANYDLLCLPTKYYAEGTPGVVVESFFAGTPCLISNYSQVKSLVKNGQTGLVYEFNNIKDLEDKIEGIYYNKYDLESISKNVLKESKKYDIDSAIIAMKKIIELE